MEKSVSRPIRADASGKELNKTGNLSLIYARAALVHDSRVPDKNRFEFDNSFLFAIFGADAEYSIGHDSDRWYAQFCKIIELSSLWTLDKGSLQSFTKQGGQSNEKFDVAKTAKRLISNQGGKEAGDSVARGMVKLVDLRRQSADYDYVTRFGLPSFEATFILGCTQSSDNASFFTVNLAALAYARNDKKLLNVFDESRKFSEISVLTSAAQYTVDTSAASYESTQKVIAEKLGDRIAKYIHRYPMSEQMI